MKNKRLTTIVLMVFLATGYIISQTTEEEIDDPIPADDPYTGFIFPVPVAKNGSTKDIIPSSPKVASLGTFGQIPVGNFTGTATINIP
jgi:hypothetical protein